jgi:cell division protease FtsH
MAFGGRIAEEMILGADGVTTGASNDIEQATRLARNMVTRWGLSEKMGMVKYDEDDGEVFLGMTAGTRPKPISGDTARQIDLEVRRIIDDCYGRAKQILAERSETLTRLAEALLEFETLTSEQIDDVMAGGRPRVVERSDRSAPTGGAPGGASAAGSGDGKPVGGPAPEY